MAAVVNCAAALRRLVYCAQILPFRGAHLRASLGGAGWVFVEEADEDFVGFLDKKAAEFVEPEGAVDSLGRSGYDEGGGVVNWCGRFGGV